jgi:hypothetical protein
LRSRIPLLQKDEIAATLLERDATGLAFGSRKSGKSVAGSGNANSEQMEIPAIDHERVSH